MHGRTPSSGLMASKWLSIAFFLICVAVLCIIVYLLVLAPMISPSFNYEDYIYHDLEYYTSGEYLNFEDGSVFQTMLFDFGAEEKGTLIDFYYVDNLIGDMPHSGKRCDIYALDKVYQQKEYLSKKKYYEDNYEQAEPIEDYLLYAKLDSLEERTFVKGVAFCDKTCVIRYVLITDFDSLVFLSNVFSRNSNLEWKAQPSTGDGTVRSEDNS